MRAPKALLIIAALFLFGAASCSDGDDGGGMTDEQKQEGIDELQATGLSEDEATCVVDYMSDNLSDDQIDQFTSDTEPENFDDALEALQPIFDVMTDAAESCDLEPADLGLTGLTE